MIDHEKYSELCTAFLTESLTDADRKTFEQHVFGCSECRQLLAQYQLVAREALPALAPLVANALPPFDEASWSESETEQKIFARLAADPAPLPESSPQTAVDVPSSAPRNVKLFRTLLPYAAGVFLSVGVGFAAYHFGRQAASDAAQAVGVAQNAPQPESEFLERLRLLADERNGLNTKVHDRDVAIGELERRIKTQAQQNEGLKTQLAGANQMVIDEQDRNAARQNELTRQYDQAQTNLADLRQQLDAWKQQRADETSRVSSLDAEIRRLNDALSDRDRTIAEQQQFLASDRDIRDLMGARDLYIAEVFDVGKNGERKKPFGRVFYTKGKSLIFYGYDLDQQSQIRNAGTFQAWGMRGPDRASALNLGILYADNAVNKRWVLRFDDNKALQQINAVFVTVEPYGGSSKPTSKPLLFAYLREEPNHP
jgi:hypothetical protein